MAPLDDESGAGVPPHRRKEDRVFGLPSSVYRAMQTLGMVVVIAGGGTFAHSSSDKLDDVKSIASQAQADLEALQKRTAIVEAAQQRVDPQWQTSMDRRLGQLEESQAEQARAMNDMARELAKVAGQMEAMRGELRSARRNNGGDDR